MSYGISRPGDDPAERGELAHFLAGFVRDGELPAPRLGDDDPAVWKNRFRWWWDENPCAGPDSPRGFILRDAAGSIVGFSGYIPLDYELSGRNLPSLLATTFFVRAAHRGAVLGLMNRQRALGKAFHIVDGSPSPEMCRLLEKLGYERAGSRFQYFFPVGDGAAPARFLLRRLGWSLSLPRLTDEACRIEKGWFETPPEDGTIRPRFDRPVVEWLCRSGTRARAAFTLRDASGAALAGALGIYKERSGMKTFHLLCHAEFRSAGLVRLLRHLVSDPVSGLDTDTRLVIFSTFSPLPGFRQRGRQVESILYHHLPPDLAGTEKTCFTIESDLVLI